MKKGSDYTVSYSNNKNVGTATITIKGKGKYKGTIKKTFKITVSKGMTYTVSSMKYKVTNVNTKSKGTVALIGTTKNKAKLTSVTIGNTVKIDVPNSKAAAYKKLFKSSTGFKKTMKIK